MRALITLLLFVVLVNMLAGRALGHDVGATVAIEPATSMSDATGYLQQYRLSGNEAWLDAAELYLLSVAPSAESSLMRAWLAQARHRFVEASAHLAPLLSTRADLSLWLLEANLKRIVGDLPAARAACRNAGAQQLALGKLCLAQVALSDEAPIDAGRLERLVHADLPRVRTIRAWAYGNLSDLYVSQGNYARARVLARRALVLLPSLQNRARLAGFLLDAGDHAATLEVVGVDPHAPALALLRIQALMASGRTPGEETERLHHAFQHDIRRGDYLHAREMAQFYLQVRPDPQLARMLAYENWQRQKEPEDRRLLSDVGMR